MAWSHILFQLSIHTQFFFQYFSLLWIKVSAFIFLLSSVSLTGHQQNFRAASSRSFTTQGVPYDIASIMHYDAYAFSRNGRPTIVPVDSSIPLSSLGQDNGFSQRDLQHIKALYCNKGVNIAIEQPACWSAWQICVRKPSVAYSNV